MLKAAGIVLLLKWSSLKHNFPCNLSEVLETYSENPRTEAVALFLLSKNDTVYYKTAGIVLLLNWSSLKHNFLCNLSDVLEKSKNRSCCIVSVIWKMGQPITKNDKLTSTKVIIHFKHRSRINILIYTWFYFTFHFSQ